MASYDSRESYQLGLVDHLYLMNFFRTILDYRNRINENARIQKQWVKEQKDEKEQINNHLANEEAQYAAQTEAMTRMRGLLEDEMTMRKN